MKNGIYPTALNYNRYIMHLPANMSMEHRALGVDLCDFPELRPCESISQIFNKFP
jgi:hypothetical protein